MDETSLGSTIAMRMLKDVKFIKTEKENCSHLFRQWLEKPLREEKTTRLHE
jgi:hypothetical protein